MRSKLLMAWAVIFLLFTLLPAATVRAQDKTTGLKSDFSKSLNLSLEEAVLLTLNRNKDLKVQILNPQIAETAIEEQKSSFDLTPYLKLKAGQTINKEHMSKTEIVNQYPGLEDVVNSDVVTTKNTDQISGGSIGFSKLFSTGTELKIDLESQYSHRKRTSSNANNSSSSSRYPASGSLSLTQPLLKGRGRKINLSLARQAEMDQKISTYELRQYVIELIAKAQKTYWDLVLAEETLKIQKKSLELSQHQLDETKERIRVGKQAESELISAQAEVAAEKGKVIDAKSNKSKITLNFLLLLNPDVNILWDQKVNLTTSPVPVNRKIGNIQEHVARALRFRPDLNQARLNLQKGNLEVVRTQNGLLPKLDFFFTLKQMANGSRFPASLGDFDNSDYSVGLNLSRPLGNTGARAQFRRANLTRLKYEESIENLKQKIQVEVRQAILEIERCQEQIIASRANLSRQEEKLKVEQEKFRVGRSTNLLVFQAQRDLTEAQVNEVTAVINQIKAFIDLQVAEGTLLKQWSIEALPSLLR